MKHLIFAVYDSKAEAFGMPMFFAAKGQAIRAFDDQCNDPSSMIGQHPGDFTLFELGSYDVSTGKITPLSTPASLGTGVEYNRSTKLKEVK